MSEMGLFMFGVEQKLPKGIKKRAELRRDDEIGRYIYSLRLDALSCR